MMTDPKGDPRSDPNGDPKQDPRYTEAQEILADYSQRDSTIDMGNLAYAVGSLFALIDELAEQIVMYRNGYQGTCITCEPTARRNRELREEKALLHRAVDDLRSSWDELKYTLEPHDQDGHNVTNAQFTAVREERDRLKERDEWAKEVVEGLCIQYLSRAETPKGLALTHDFMSAGEQAFDFLDWGDPYHLVPEMECDDPGCHREATCGTPTPNGYRRVCGRHYSALKHQVGTESEHQVEETERTQSSKSEGALSQGDDDD